MSVVIEKATLDEQELRERKKQLVGEKQQAQSELVGINSKMAVRLPDLTYKILQRQRHDAVQRLQKIETKLGQVKEQLRAYESNANGILRIGDRQWVIRNIREVRDKYQAIAAGEYDAHGPSERALAAQVARDLNPLLRLLINE